MRWPVIFYLILTGHLAINRNIAIPSPAPPQGKFLRNHKFSLTVTCNKPILSVTWDTNERSVMGTPVKERIRKMRQKRKGQSLTVWLYPEAAHVFKKIKKLTGQTNDEIVNLAVQEIYHSVYYGLVNKSIERIRVKLSEEVPRIEMATLYRDLIRIFQLDYDSASGIKKALNSWEVPNYSGKTGNWKINQVRELMK